MAEIKYISLSGLSRFYQNLKDKHLTGLTTDVNDLKTNLGTVTTKANNVYAAFQAFLGGTWNDSPAPTLVEIKDSLDALVQADKDIKALTINGKALSTSPVLVASDIKLSAAVGDMTTANTIQETLANLNSRIGTVESAAGVSKLVGGDGTYVKVTAGNEGVGEVTLSIDDSAITTALNSKANSADVYTKTEVDGVVAGKADKATTLAGYGIADAYTKTETDGAITAAFNDFATKVSDDGVVNSYKELIDYAAEHGSEFTELVGVVAGKANSADVYTKTEVDGVVAGKADKATTLAGYGIADAYTKTETDNTISTAVAGKADKATTLAGYGIADAYTKTEVDTELAKKVNATDLVAATDDDIDGLFA